MKSLLIAVALTFMVTNNVYAGFDWGNNDGQCSGSGQFSQSLQKDAIVYIGEIPNGKKGVFIQLLSQRDLDVQLYDKVTGDEIVAWPNGILNGPYKSNTSYGSMNIEWSGYKGDCPDFSYGTEDYSICKNNTSPGNEYIKINETKRDLVMKAYAFRSGSASVQYSWTGTTGCTEGSSAKGEGTFQQYIVDYNGDYEKTATVGDIPAGLKDIYIGLKSKEDVDIRLYDEDGTLIIHWPNGKLSGSGKQSINYKGVKIEYSGYGGDCPTYNWNLHNSSQCSFGHEYIKIRGTTQNKFIMKAFGYQAGTASVDYSWGKYTIFTGISGGAVGTLIDNSDPIESWKDSVEIKSFLSKKAGLDCSDCMPNNDSSLTKIANNNVAGGIVAIAYNVANTVLSRSSFNRSGNTDVLRADIETYYDDNSGAKVFIAGHSTGGGDVQNLLWKLNTLGIPVEMSGHIDSIEIGSDAIIPGNVKRAMNFYQADNFPRGEDLLYTLSSKPVITNTRISDPLGPCSLFKDQTDVCQYDKNGNFDEELWEYSAHRNMDNDKRVWGTLLNYIKSNR